MFALVCLVHSYVMTDSRQTDIQSTNIIPHNAIYKKVIKKSCIKMKKVTTMSRSYDLEIWCVWLPGCVNVGVKKLSHNISENTDV